MIWACDHVEAKSNVKSVVHYQGVQGHCRAEQRTNRATEAYLCIQLTEADSYHTNQTRQPSDYTH